MFEVVYVAVRLDMPLHQQIVQVGHAAFNAGKFFGLEQPDDGPNLVVLGIANEIDLRDLAYKINQKIPVTIWCDAEDFGQGKHAQVTAFATAPISRNKGRKLFWNNDLWQPPQHTTGSSSEERLPSRREVEGSMPFPVAK